MLHLQFNVRSLVLLKHHHSYQLYLFMSLFLSHKTLLADRHAWLKCLYSFLFLSGFRVQLRPAQMDKSLVGFLFLFLPCSSSSFSLSSFSGGWKSVYSSETLSSSSAVGVWNAMPADIRFQTHQHFECPTPSSLFPSVSTCKALRVPSTETPGPGTETPALALALSPHRLRRGQMLCPSRSWPGQSSPVQSSLVLVLVVFPFQTPRSSTCSTDAIQFLPRQFWGPGGPPFC